MHLPANSAMRLGNTVAEAHGVAASAFIVKREGRQSSNNTRGRFGVPQPQTTHSIIGFRIPAEMTEKCLEHTVPVIDDADSHLLPRV